MVFEELSKFLLLIRVGVHASSFFLLPFLCGTLSINCKALLLFTFLVLITSSFS